MSEVSSQQQYQLEVLVHSRNYGFIRIDLLSRRALEYLLSIRVTFYSKEEIAHARRRLRKLNTSLGKILFEKK